MESVFDRRPDLNLASDEDSDDDNENGCGQPTAIFSRSSHLKSLGMDFVAIETEENDISGTKETDSVMPLQSQGDEKEASNEEFDNQKTDSDAETDWTKFSSDFSESLQVSEQRLASGQFDEQGLPLNDLKEQLLLDAILAMHDEDEDPDKLQTVASMDAPTAIGAAHSCEHSASTTVDVEEISEGSISPSKTRRSILSLSALETIHESELDRVLETVPDLPHLPASNQTTDVGANDKPPPKLVWGKEDTSVLLTELELLSKSEVRYSETQPIRNLSTSLDKWSKINKGHTQSVTGGGTIFLDLRSSQEEAHEPHERGTSEDDDSDDPYAWIVQRKHIKHSLQTSSATPPHSPLIHSSQPHKVVPSLATPPHNPLTQPDKVDPTQTKKSFPAHKPQVDNSTHRTSAEAVITANRKHTQDLETEGNTEQQVLSKLESNQTATIVTNSSEVNRMTNTLAVDKDSQPVSSSLEGSKRKRNSGSLTLSSSLSEGEAPSSEGANVSNRESPAASSPRSSFASPSASPTKGKKKEAKKSKKSRKKDKTQSAKKNPTKVSQRKLARALVLERIRNDSLTTSSDEEHCLTPTIASDLSGSVSSSDAFTAALGCQESEEELLDPTKVKVRLQKLILSKKPPAQFVTPATIPVFHEVVSFEPPPLSTDPSRATDALFVFPLSGYGLIAPPNDRDGEMLELDLQTQLSFHLLLLTWLVCQAEIDSIKCPPIPAETTSPELLFEKVGNRNVDDRETTIQNGKPDFIGCPFRITGMLQTVHDGHPSLLVGVSIPPHMRRTGSSDNGSFTVCPDSDLQNDNLSESFKAYLQTTHLSQFVSSILQQSEVQYLIPGQALDQLKDIVCLPLDSFFNVQEDVTSLTTPASFYWHSGYHISSLPSIESLQTQARLATTVSTISGESLLNHKLVFTTLHTVYDNAMDLVGLRIVYGMKLDELTSIQDVAPSRSESSSVTLALAIRAPDAVYRWLDLVGPEDCNLAKITDPNSLVAKFGGLQCEVLNCIRTPYLALATLCKWFGGRACLRTGSILGISDPRTKHERKKRQRVRFSESESEDGLPLPVLDLTFPPLISNRPCLIAHPYTKILLVVAPMVPPSLYGVVFSACSKLGYDVLGMKRMRLNSKRASALQIPKIFMSNFTPSSAPPSPDVVDFVTHPLSTEHAQFAPPYPSIILHLGMENALLHSIPLKQVVFADLAVTLEDNPFLKENASIDFKESCPESLLHVMEVTQEASKVLGSFSLSTNVSSSLPQLHDSRQGSGMLVDELCFVAIPQCTSMPILVSFLNTVYQIKSTKNQNGNETSFSFSTPSLVSDSDREELGGFELLGVKVVPQLSRYYAKRLCPFSSTDPLYPQATQQLSDVPATLFLFRGMDCSQRLSNLLKQQSAKPKIPLYGATLQNKLEIIVSKNYEEAFNLSCIFFSDKELFVDAQSFDIAPCLPSSWLQDMTILQELQQPPNKLFAVVTVCMSDMRLVLRVLDKLSRSGFNFVGMVATELHENETIIEDLENVSGSPGSDSTSEPGLVLCVQRVNAVWYLMYVLGPYIEQQRKSTSACSRHTLTLSYPESFAAAIADIKTLFSDGICCEATAITEQYKIPCAEKDAFSNIFLPDNCKPVSTSSLVGFISPLLETTAMILPPNFLVKESRLATTGFLEVVEFLTQAGFEIRGLKMVCLSMDLAKALLSVCDCVAGIEAHSLCSGPTLVLIVRRDNAASCCQLIFRSAVQSSSRGHSSSLPSLLSQMIVPSSAEQARETLKLFTKINSQETDTGK